MLALSQIAEGFQVEGSQFVRRALLVQSPDSEVWKDEALKEETMSSGKEKGKKGGDGKGMKGKDEGKGDENPQSDPVEEGQKGKGEEKGKGEGKCENAYNFTSDQLVVAGTF